MMNNVIRVESKLEISDFIQKLHYALEHGARINFQAKRKVDENRDEKYTNQYTVRTLFPDENPTEALRRELLKLSVEDYIQTVKDIRWPNRGELREFGKVYEGEDVYIKIRVELLGVNGERTTFVMSFHFAENAFKPEMFPYRNNLGEAKQ